MSAPPTKFRIDIVSDVVCPWRIIGYRQLQEALSRLDGEFDADVHWHPFELSPMMPPEGQRIYNTFLAHQLLAWAAQHHKQSALDEIEAAALLEDGRYAADVREHQRFWLSKGIQAVPSFILDRRYLIPGAQDPDVFVAAFEKLTEEAAELQPANST